MRRRKLEQLAPVGEREPSGCIEREPRRSVVQVRGSEARRGAVGVAELGDGAGDRLVHVPAAAAEERGAEALLAEPLAFAADALAGVGLACVGRAWVGDVQCVWWPSGP